ncbi:MAG: AMP-binding protein [bacterium]|nr:AMP-binding protein [bacterium]
MLYIKNKSITYNELFLKAKLISKQLQDLGIKENDEVILFFPISIELYCILLALFKLGATTIFIEPRIINNIQNIINYTNPKAIIYNYYFQILKLFNQKIKDNSIPLKITTSIITFNKEKSLKIPKINENLYKETDKNIKDEIFNKNFFDKVAIISFTSGSNKTPKGVIRTYKTIFKQGEYLYKNMKITSKDIDFTNLPLFALKNIYYNISSYLYYISNWENINIKEIINYLKKSTTITVSLGLLKYIINYCKEKRIILDNIRLIYTGGAPVYLEFLKELKEIFINSEIEVLYGSTEAEPIAHINLNELNELNKLNELSYLPGVCVGKPINDIDVKIINEIKVYNVLDFKTLDFKVGEIVVNGENIANGYIPNNLNQNKIEIDKKNYHKIGDIGYFDNLGNLWILGKSEPKFLINNFYLFPLQIEQIIDKTEGVEKSAFIINNNKAFIFIKLKKIKKNNFINIKKTIEQRIKEILVKLNLDFYIIFRDIPLDKRHNSKVDYQKLTEIISKNYPLK